MSALALALVAFGPGAAQTRNQPTAEFLQRTDLNGYAGGSLVVAVNVDPSSFSRLFSTGVANTMITDRLNGDLVHINRTTFELEPALAKSWQLDPDGRTYTIRLRRGLSFSDGSPFTADDVLFTFQVMQDPKSGVALADQVKVDGAFPSVAKVDAHTVRLSYERPLGMGLRSLDSVPMLPKARLEKAYRAGSLASTWGPATAPPEIVGMGPFRLKEYQRGVKVVMERNPFYWKTDKANHRLPYLDTLTFLIVPDPNSEALRFRAGELDLVNLLNAENFAILRRGEANSGYSVRDLGPGVSFDFFWFNLHPGMAPSGKPWVDPEKRALFEQAQFRRAVSLAINRSGIAKSVMLGLATPAYGPISSGNSAWYDPKLPNTGYDPARASALLAQSRLKDTDGDGILEFGGLRRPLEVTLHTARGNTAREKTAEIVRKDLARVGIRVNLQLALPNELAQRLLVALDYQAMLFGFTTTDVAPDSQSDLWYSSGSFHFWHPKQAKPYRLWEAQMDQLTSRLVRTLDPAERIRVFTEMQRLWVRELPAFPLVVPNVLTGWRNNVGNVRPSLLVPHLIWNAEELTSAPRNKT